VEKLPKKAELIEQWLAENQPKIGAAGREKQSNITDNGSATMVTSHGAVQGYNSQAFIDAKHQIIIHGEAFGDGPDHGHIPPMLTGALENLQSLAMSRITLRARFSPRTAITILWSICRSARNWAWMPIFLTESSATATRDLPPRSGAR
jgi:hypothetical protein